MPQSQTMAPRERKATREQEDNIKAQNNDQTQTQQTMVATINNTPTTTTEQAEAVLN